MKNTTSKCIIFCLYFREHLIVVFLSALWRVWSEFKNVLNNLLRYTYSDWNIFILIYKLNILHFILVTMVSVYRVFINIPVIFIFECKTNYNNYALTLYNIVKYINYILLYRSIKMNTQHTEFQLNYLNFFLNIFTDIVFD